MSYRDFSVTTLIAGILTPVVFVSMGVSDAQVMQSTSYRIQSDSINFAGGLSTSTNYVLEATAGEIATGDSDSTNYGLRAGYQQMVSNYISISAADNIVLTPAIPGVGGGTSNGSTTVTVITDSAAGYELTIEASQSPAMQKGGDSLADYVPVGDPDFSFNTTAADAHFGYTPSGADIPSRFKDDGATTCASGSFDTDLACWDGLSTTPEVIARKNSANHPSGSTTTVSFRVGIGGSVVQPAGAYTATTTLTAMSL